jgi:chromosome segregation protein
MTREGHAVSQYAVAFYAPDSEQAGMLARAQEIENLERQLRAQALIADERAARMVRAEAAYTDASQRLVGAPRSGRSADARAPAAGRAAAPDAAGRADSTPRGQLDDELAEVDAQLEELTSAAPPARRASRSSTCSSRPRRSATPSSTKR